MSSKSATSWAEAAPRAAKRIFHNGRIYTVDRRFSRVSTLAVQGEKIVYAGNDLKLAAARLGEKAEQVDLQGKTLVPGLIDSHIHFLTLGRSLMEIDIFHKSRAQILELVAAEARRLGPGRWVLGRGWDHDLWPTDGNSQWPDRRELDAVAPDNPVLLNRADSHSAWLNSAALLAAGLNDGSQAPQGGEILRRPDGTLQGILIDTAMYQAWAALPSLDAAGARQAFLKAQAGLLRLGLCSIGDAWVTLKDYAFLKEAYAGGEMKMRLYCLMATDELEILQRQKKVDPARPEFKLPDSGLYGGRLSLRACKIVCDGSLGSRSAWLTHDYADRPGHRGSRRYSDRELGSLMSAARDCGLQVCLHAIGDAAVRQVLDVAGEVLGEGSCADQRWRIEHFQTVAPPDIERALSLGFIPVMQTVHGLSDREMARKRLNAETLAISYPWRGVLDRGGIIANSSDGPMDVYNPFLGFYAAVARQPFPEIRPPQKPEEIRLSRREALESYTTHAARAEFAEALKGSLEVGKFADFALLDRDLMTCPEAEIPETKVLMTVLGGEILYRAENDTM